MTLSDASDWKISATFALPRRDSNHGTTETGTVVSHSTTSPRFSSIAGTSPRAKVWQIACTLATLLMWTPRVGWVRLARLRRRPDGAEDDDRAPAIDHRRLRFTFIRERNRAQHAVARRVPRWVRRHIGRPTELFDPLQEHHVEPDWLLQHWKVSCVWHLDDLNTVATE